MIITASIIGLLALAFYLYCLYGKLTLIKNGIDPAAWNCHLFNIGFMPGTLLLCIFLITWLSTVLPPQFIYGGFGALIGANIVVYVEKQHKKSFEKNREWFK